MAADKVTPVFEDVFEEGEPQEAQTIHRIRANSTIMQLKKILGGCLRRDESCPSRGPPGRPMDIRHQLTVLVLPFSRQSR